MFLLKYFAYALKMCLQKDAKNEICGNVAYTKLNKKTLCNFHVSLLKIKVPKKFVDTKKQITDVSRHTQSMKI